MPARHFRCLSCGVEQMLPARYAEGETPSCCGREMEELLPDRQARPPRLPRAVVRRVCCPRCGAEPQVSCRGVDGGERRANHVERVRAAADPATR